MYARIIIILEIYYFLVAFKKNNFYTVFNVNRCIHVSLKIEKEVNMIILPVQTEYVNQPL